MNGDGLFSQCQTLTSDTTNSGLVLTDAVYTYILNSKLLIVSTYVNLYKIDKHMLLMFHLF